jgi:hypothetical protein
LGLLPNAAWSAPWFLPESPSNVEQMKANEFVDQTKVRTLQSAGEAGVTGPTPPPRHRLSIFTQLKQY